MTTWVERFAKLRERLEDKAQAQPTGTPLPDRRLLSPAGYLKEASELLKDVTTHLNSGNLTETFNSVLQIVEHQTFALERAIPSRIEEEKSPKNLTMLNLGRMVALTQKMQKVTEEAHRPVVIETMEKLINIVKEQYDSLEKTLKIPDLPDLEELAKTHKKITPDLDNVSDTVLTICPPPPGKPHSFQNPELNQILQRGNQKQQEAGREFSL